MSTPDEMIFLSGTRETQSRTNLFRPKELREVVFPGLGMIMHSLFWIKHAFYLAEKGCSIGEQDSILLWASGETTEYTESLLFYCIYSNMNTAGEVTVNAGERTTRNWLLRRDTEREGGIYTQLSANLRSLAEHPTSPDYEAFIEASLAPWFRTRCDELGIDVEAELREGINPAMDMSNLEKQERALAEGFSTAMGQLVSENPSLRSGKNMQVISTTTSFAHRVYEVATPAQRLTLANTTLEITADEATALLEAVGQMENGEHFLRSLLFILYLDPLTHPRDEIEQQMRHLYDFVTEDSEAIVADVQTEYRLSAVSDRIREGLDATAFYWVLNFFMSDGETVARDLLEDADSPIEAEDVRDYFETHPSTAGQYRSFFQYTSDSRPYLSRLLTDLQRNNTTSTIVFIETLMEGLNTGHDPDELFLDLLASQDTIEEKSEGRYLISTRPQNTNAASFYGIGPLVSWAQTLAASVRYE